MALAAINRNPTNRELKHFALFWFPLFSLILGWALHSHGACFFVSVVIWSLGVLLAPLGFWFPAFIKPVFLGMTYCFFPIGWVVSHLILLVVYFMVFTPIGLFLKLCGRDLLERKSSPGAESYWKELKPRSDSDDYFKQF